MPNQTPESRAVQSDRQAKLDKAHLLIQKAKREGRDLSESEAAQCDTLIAEAEQLQAQWENMPQASCISRPNLGYGGPQPAFTPSPTGLLGTDGGSVADSLFGKKSDAGGFGSFGQWLETLDSGLYDARMQAANKIGVDSDGGFLVPTIYQNMFIDAVLENTILANRVRRFPMTSDTLKISGFDGNDHSSNLFGGLAAAWESELPTLSEQSPKARQISFTAKKLMILTRASNEMVSDAAACEQMLGSALVQSTAWQLDYALLRGNGAGQPLGCVASDSAISVAKESSQTASTIWYDNVLKMFSRLHPACYKNALWCANPTCIPQLMKLDVHESATATGSALVGDFAYQPFRETDGRFSLFGRPCEFTEKLPTLGTVGDIVLVDPTQYGLAMRQEVIVEKSVSAGFVTDSSYFRSKLRCDGQPLWAKVMTPRAGDSLSWCVTLATRN